MDNKPTRYMVLADKYCIIGENEYQAMLDVPNDGLYALVGSWEELQMDYPGCTEFKKGVA